MKALSLWIALSFDYKCKMRTPPKGGVSMTEKTILVDQYISTSKNEFDIENLPIHALPGLHDFVFTKAMELVSLGSTILELASGSGAMAKRLVEAGYIVTASDYVQENFRLHDLIPFISGDLNESFSNKHANLFDCIIAIEIIEHLENPRHFLRECKKLLKPNGLLIFTTPNIDNPVSKAFFVRHGYYQWFSDKNYKTDGHITPISQWLACKIIKEHEFEIVQKTSFGNPFNQISKWPRLKFLAKIIQNLNVEKGMDGELAVYILKK